MDGRQAIIEDLIGQREEIAKEIAHWRQQHQQATQMILRCEGAIQVLGKQIERQEKKMADQVSPGETAEPTEAEELAPAEAVAE